MRSLGLFSALTIATLASGAAPQPATLAEVLAASQPADWRALDPANTVYLELDTGRVVIELAPAFAPALVANVKTLVRERFFDGLAVMRVQDNYVVQWGDADGHRPLGTAAAKVPAELARSDGGLPFTALADTDAYAPQTGFADGFPAARDPASGRAWLTHCYGMVGVGRDTPPESGNGTELYAVIGHAPRHLDRNVVLIGRVVQGIELFSVMPRGKAEMGFYQPQERVPLRTMRLASELPEAQRSHLEALRTDTASFAALIEARRHRREGWFVDPVGRIEVCNVPLPVRPVAAAR